MPLTRRSFLGLIPVTTLFACKQNFSPIQHASRENFSGIGPIQGTTLESISLPNYMGHSYSGKYTHLTSYPGLPVIKRTELVTPHSNIDTRLSLLSFVQISDAHIMDAESPVRADFIEGIRPQELLTKHGFISMIERIRALEHGPHTGRKIECIISTGDQTDNLEMIELDWFFKILNGGTFIPKAGDPHRVEGMQTWGDKHIWQPDNPRIDNYKKRGFPYLPGFMSAICQPVQSRGLNIPWYSVFGNHDAGAFGATATPEAFASVFTGKYKADNPRGIKPSKNHAQRAVIFAPFAEAIKRPGGAVYKNFVNHYSIREVTPDMRRIPFTRQEYIQAHLNPHNIGPGPLGHGYTQEALDSDKTWSSVTLGEDIICILLDSTSHYGSGSTGSIGERQLRDIERELQSVNSRYYDSTGKLVKHEVADQLCLVFSHHTSWTMNNLSPDPAYPADKRYSGAELIAFLQRFPNVIAWINGHEHHNKIIPHPGSTPDRSFWEINTASHIDFPHHSRIIELADNQNGTLSIFTTLIESNAPTRPTSGELTLANLAALYREIAANAGTPGKKRYPLALYGDPRDHNTELLLKHPLT